MNRNLEVMVGLFLVAVLWLPGTAVADERRLGQESLQVNQGYQQGSPESTEEKPREYSLDTSLNRNRSSISESTGPIVTEDSPKEQLNPIRDRSFYAGLAYPGALLGFQTESFAFELRGFKQGDITIYGPRMTHYMLPFPGGNFYWGFDAQYIDSFEGDLTEGDGYMGTGFLGLQKFLGSRVSFNVDAGPSFIEIEDDLSGVKVDGFEFVVNTSLNVHF